MLLLPFSVLCLVSSVMCMNRGICSFITYFRKNRKKQSAKGKKRRIGGKKFIRFLYRRQHFSFFLVVAFFVVFALIFCCCCCCRRCEQCVVGVVLWFCFSGRRFLWYVIKLYYSSRLFLYYFYVRFVYPIRCANKNRHFFGWPSVRLSSAM